MPDLINASFVLITKTSIEIYCYIAALKKYIKWIFSTWDMIALFCNRKHINWQASEKITLLIGTPKCSEADIT